MSGAWNPEKVKVFRESFYDFLQHVEISSRDTGSTVLGDCLYRAQTMFYDTVFDALAEDVHDIYCLKSRQLGISTSTRALTLFWLGMHDGLRGTMVFDTSFNTQAARGEIIEILSNLPAKLKFPCIKKGGSNRNILMLENNSWLVFNQAGVKNAKSGGGLGRSFGINLVHASEICSWVNEEGLTSFRQSLSEEFEDRLYIWESTGRGYNIWHTMWTEAVNDKFTKKTVFIGWWAKDNQIISRDDVRWGVYAQDPPNKRELERMQTVEREYGWRITPEQLAWYRWKTDPGREIDEDDPEDSNMVQEQPFTSEECFQVTGSTFFQAETLNKHIANVSTKDRPQAFRFWPGIDFVTCDMQPARTRRETDFRIWEEPAQDSWYVVSGDPAFGHDENNNNSAAQVLRCYADGLDQVAEFASATIQPHQFAWLLWTLVGYYGSKPGSQVLMICELNGPGEEVWRQYNAVPMIVRNGYLRKAADDKGIANIFQNARTYIHQRSDSMSAGHVYQWVTNSQRKVQIMEGCRNYLHTGLLTVNSVEALEEMRTITRDGDTIGAENRNRDDRTFALALGVRGWDEKIRRQMIAGNRTKAAERAKFSMSIQDQWDLFHRNNLATFFKKKEQDRMSLQMMRVRAGWRAGVGQHRAPTGRRW